MRNKVRNTINFLYEMGTLRKIPRGHMQTLLTSDISDNIASHSFRVAIIGWLLAEAEKADVNKVIKMCLIHDSEESRSGDQNWVHKKYLKVFEEEIVQEQLSSIPTMFRLSKEYSERKSKESQIAKDADLLDQILLLKEYEMQGNKEAVRWLAGAEQRNKLSTKTAKVWVKEILKQDPSDWWQDLWTSKRR